MFFQTLCVCNLTSASRATPSSTAADETGHDWRMQSLVMRGGLYLYSLSKHTASSFDFRAEFNFFFKDPLLLPTGNLHKYSVLAMLQQENKYLYGFMFFRSLCIVLCVAPNIICWNALYLTKLVFHSLSSVKNIHTSLTSHRLIPPKVPEFE